MILLCILSAFLPIYLLNIFITIINLLLKPRDWITKVESGIMDSIEEKKENYYEIPNFEQVFPNLIS